MPYKADAQMSDEDRERVQVAHMRGGYGVGRNGREWWKYHGEEPRLRVDGKLEWFGGKTVIVIGAVGERVEADPRTGWRRVSPNTVKKVKQGRRKRWQEEDERAERNKRANAPYRN